MLPKAGIVLAALHASFVCREYPLVASPITPDQTSCSSYRSFINHARHSLILEAGELKKPRIVACLSHVVDHYATLEKYRNSTDTDQDH